MSGTDHGTAGLMFLVGPSVRGGMYGVQPSLRYLDSGGDMRHHLDFRSVYASVLEDWLSADAVGILGSNYERLNLFAAGSNLGPHPLPGSTLNRFPDVDQSRYYAAGSRLACLVGNHKRNKPDDVLSQCSSDSEPNGSLSLSIRRGADRLTAQPVRRRTPLRLLCRTSRLAL